MGEIKYECVIYSPEDSEEKKVIDFAVNKFGDKMLLTLSAKSISELELKCKIEECPCIRYGSKRFIVAATKKGGKGK